MTAAAARLDAPVLVHDEPSLWDVLGELHSADADDVRHALVPTMGALHAGHAALIRRARELAPVTVVSIFVNPLQFGAGEDFDRYPRTLEADVGMCAAEGVDVVFAPPVDELYPLGDPRVTVSAGRLGTVLEGAARPGHFDGVLTVVLKLFHLVQPDAAVFGEKDYQQLALIRRMVADLDVDVDVVGVPTVREPDGLALSSRNRYLSDDDRRAALALPRALQAGVAASGDGVAAVLAAARAELETEPAVTVDYLSLVDPVTFDEVTTDTAGPGRLLVAARVGGTRLLDNAPVDLGTALG
jgi:pantoate--beta-alanine ligase